MNFNDQQQLNQVIPAAASYSPPASLKLARKRRGNWLWVILAALIVILAVIFGIAVYSEISSRDAKLRNVLEYAQRETSGAIIQNELLSGLAGTTATSTAAAASSTNALGAVSGSSSNNNRQLAEKSGRPELGNASSSLVIVEFADFECPVSLQEFPIIRAITNKYSKDIRFIFRNYPVIDQNSLMLAEAGLCAQEQGKFWPFHDRLYSNQGQIASTDDLQRIVVMSGVNWNKLQDCVNKEKYKNQVLEDMSDALDLGVAGTPTFFVNGKKLAGAIDAATWEQIIAKYKELNTQ